MTVAAPPRPAAPGRRWVRGTFSLDKNLRTGAERWYSDSCVRCFLRFHEPERCDEPNCPEWFEIKDRDGDASI